MVADESAKSTTRCWFDGVSDDSVTVFPKAPTTHVPFGSDATFFCFFFGLVFFLVDDDLKLKRPDCFIGIFFLLRPLNLCFIFVCFLLFLGLDFGASRFAVRMALSE